ncbi:hypothetical protein LINGRAHAP2_LOCUS30215 [Linum grandiflorum]
MASLSIALRPIQGRRSRRRLQISRRSGGRGFHGVAEAEDFAAEVEAGDFRKGGMKLGDTVAAVEVGDGAGKKCTPASWSKKEEE